MIFFTTAKPKPVPLLLVVTYGSNALANILAGNPDPESHIVNRTAFC